MMSQVVPSDGDLGGALALVKLALDPKSAKVVLDRLAAAKAEVNEKLADLAERQAKFNQGKAEFVKERDEHQVAVRNHASHAAELRQAKVVHDNNLQTIERAERQMAEDKAKRDASYRERDSALAQRERDVTQLKREVDAQAEALKKQEASLAQRDAAVRQGEADLREKRAKLEAVLA